jgi:hypothetical protein
MRFGQMFSQTAQPEQAARHRQIKRRQTCQRDASAQDRNQTNYFIYFPSSKKGVAEGCARENQIACHWLCVAKTIL